MKSKVKEIIFPIVFCGVTFGIFGPLQLFIINAHEFWFSIDDIWWPCVVTSVFAMIVLTAIGCALPEKVRSIYSAALFGIAVALYIQGNYVNTDYGVLDGNSIRWSDYTGVAIWNTALWIICIVAPIVCTLHIPTIVGKVEKYASAFILAVEAITLLFLLITTQLPNNHNTGYLTTKNLSVVSTDENVVVFVLDTLDQNYFQEILDTEPEYLSPLDGFTYFKNNVGHYPTTKGALPYLLTGQEYRNEQPYYDYIQSAYEHTDFYSDLQKNGWDIGIFTESIYLRSPRCVGMVSNYINTTPTVSSHFGLISTFYRLTGFRYMPHILKPWFVLYSGEFDRFCMIASSDNSESAFDLSNVAYYKYLLDNPVESVPGKAFRFIHILGAHPPFNLNENVEVVGEGNSDYLQQTKAALHIINDYLAQLKAVGAYDQTTFLIIADHGRTDTGAPENPIFLAKRQNDTGKLRISKAPVAQADLQATIMEDIGLNAGKKYGKSAFDYEEGELRERNFLYYSWDGDWDSNYLPNIVEYTVDSASTDRSSYHVLLQDIEPYKLGTALTFMGENTALPYQVEGFSWKEEGGTWSLGTTGKMALSLRNHKGGDLLVKIVFPTVFHEQELIISVSGNVVFDEIISEGQEISFDIPTQYVENTLIIEFSYPDAISPQKLGESSDTRELAVSFAEMIISNK